MVLIHGGDIEGYRLEFDAMPLDFSANINPLGLPPSVRHALAEAAEAAQHYPDPLCRRLTAALAGRENVDPAHILCGNGAADLIFRLVLAKKPARALITAPTFAEYQLALESVGCAVEQHPLMATDGFNLNESILARLRPGLDMLFLCNPNNPTGLLIAPDLLERIAARCAEYDILLAVDECFNGLLDEPLHHSLRGSLTKYDNLLIFDAFTKLYAMPGLRLGYALSANAALLAAMHAAGQPWAVSAPAQAAGLAALAEADYLQQTRALIHEEREYLRGALAEAGLTVLCGEANFLFFHSSLPYLAERLRARGLLIRDCANYQGLGKGYYRVAVRTRADNLRLIKYVQMLVEEDSE